MEARLIQKVLISILMESALYLILPLKERQALLARLEECYPFVAEVEDKDGLAGCQPGL